MKQTLKLITPSLLAYAALLILLLIQLAINWYKLPLEPGVIIGPSDPDPWLRLTIVRDLLTSGDWYNHQVPRSDAPYGLSVNPWTRPLDTIIAFFTLIQPASVDMTTRLVRAALIMPVLWIIFLQWGIYRATKPFTKLPLVPFLIIALIACSFSMRNYFGVGNADHHSLLAVVFIWALGGILHPNPSRKHIVFSGLLFALQLWISPEALLLIAAVYSWFGLNWLTSNSTSAKSLPLLSTTIFVGSVFAVMIERPPNEWFIPIYDSISIVYVFILAVAAALAWIFYGLRSLSWISRLGVAVLGGGVSIGLLNYAYPLMLSGPLVNASPYIFSDFLPNINEAKPLFSQSTTSIICSLIQPSILLTFLIIMWRKPSAIFTRKQCNLFIYYTIATLGLYCVEVRFSYYFYPLCFVIYSCIVAALMLPEHASVLGQWPASWLVGKSPNQQMLRRLPLILAILMLPLVIAMLAPDKKDEEKEKTHACYQKSRTIIEGGLLNHLVGDEPLTLFAPTDLGGEILFWTPHRIVASNYHRDGEGIRYVWEAGMITDSVALKTYLNTRKINALFLCPLFKKAEGSILEKLQQGAPPPSWLVPVPYTLPVSPDLEKDEATQIEGSNPLIFLVKH